MATGSTKSRNVIEGEFNFVVGAERMRLAAGESIFIPRKTAHLWGPEGDKPGKTISVYQPAGNMEEFFRELGNLEDLPTREDVLNETYTEEQIASLQRVFEAHGMDLLGPPLTEE